MRNGLIRLSRAALGVAACFGGVASTVAAPTLPSVVAGQASFSQDGNVFSITNTPGTIINWQSFSVNAGEVTRFIQQSSDSAVLNRVLGGDPSRILGALQSNGKVFLINPNGVVFGQGARVDVNGLVASTLNMSDADFRAGKKHFTAGPSAGTVRNEGAITTPSGGKVFLVAPNVENSGVITAPNGEVVLAAGRSVQLVDSGNPDLSVVVSAPGDQAINLGQVVAQGGRIGIFGALVNQRGVVNANSAVVGQDGRIVFKASKDAVLEAGSVTSAGSIDLRANERINLAAGSKLASPDYIDLKSNQMTLAGSIGGVNGVAPVVSFNSFDSTREILVRGSGPTGALVLDPARLAAFEAYGINIGNSGHGAAINIDQALTMAGNLVIDTGGVININAPVRLTGANSQFIGTLHKPFGSAVMVTSMGSIEAARKISLLGADRVQLDGSMTSGDIDISAGSGGIQLRHNLVANGTLSLRSQGQLLQESASSVRTPRLLVEGATVQMPGANQVGTLAGKATGAETGNLQFHYTGDLKIGTVAGVSGLAAPVELSLSGGALNVDANIEARAVTLEADAIRAGAGTVTASSMLSLASKGGIGAAGSPLRTSATVLNATNTPDGSSSAPISIQNDRALRVRDVVQAGGANGGAISIESTGGLTVEATTGSRQGVRTGSGDISLVTHSPLVIEGNVSTVSGNVSLVAGNDGPLSITGKVKSESGNVSIRAGETSYAPEAIEVAPGKLSVVKTKPEEQKPDQTPPLGTCLTNPAMTGCNRVIEQATQDCIATPETPQCRQVLPQPQTCRDDPGKLGCGAVLVRECIASPKAESCTGVLPSYATCEKTPGTYGCAPVIVEHQEIERCIRTPKDSTCAGVLPPYDTCEKNPAAHGCGPVIVEYQEIERCIRTPKDATCTGVLPAYDTCEKNPTAHGCGPVIVEYQEIERCIRTPKDATCTGVLPPYDTCEKNPTAHGCGPVVFQYQEVERCIRTPKDATCTGVLPPYDTCEKNPTAHGCGPVITQRNEVTACMATPSAPGCREILPPLDACRATPGVYGCSAVVERAEFVACVANPTGAGCGERLPALSVCKLTPGAEGCAQRVELTFNACLVNKNDPSCAGILPTLAQCEANKAMAGCSVVLPSMQQCILGPTQQGCAAVLPKLEQCAVNPNQQGCEAVLPKPDFCSTHPTDPRCVVFNPAPTQGGGEAKKPVTQVQQNTVSLINTRTPAQEKLPAATPTVGTPDGGNNSNSGAASSGGEGGAGSSKPSEQSENGAGPAAGTNTGAKNEKPATKMYCN